MRYAVLELIYEVDAESNYVLDIQTEVLRIYHTFLGAYEYVDKRYDEMVEGMRKHFLEVKGQLKTKDYILKKFDNGKTKVCCSIIESGFVTNTITKFYIQAIDELTQM